MFGVIDISYDNRERAGSHCRREATVSHHYWHVVLHLFFMVECRQAGHDPSARVIVTCAWNVKNTVYYMIT